MYTCACLYLYIYIHMCTTLVCTAVLSGLQWLSWNLRLPTNQKKAPKKQYIFIYIYIYIYIIYKSVPGFGVHAPEHTRNPQKNHPKIILKSSKNHPKTIQKSSKNHPKIIRKSSKNQLKII